MRNDYAMNCLSWRNALMKDFLLSGFLAKFALISILKLKNCTWKSLIYSDDSGFGKNFGLGINGRSRKFINNF